MKCRLPKACCKSSKTRREPTDMPGSRRCGWRSASWQGVETESLRFCFDVVTRDSVAQDARLEIIETAGQGWCMECACNVAVTARYEPCPNCGSFQIEVTGGEEMRVKELEVE